jgi:ABC-type dipeptide/oligopeptide/nickel transport system permease component
VIVYTLKRLALAVSLVWAVSFGAFVAFGLSFDPLYQLNLCGDSCKKQRDALAAQYHLHDPILSRYWRWLTGLFHNGFGHSVYPSFFSSSTAIDPGLFRALGVTAQLMASALVLTVLFAVAIGVASARRPGSALDVLLRVFAYVSWSLPTFLTGVLLTRWLGPTGWFYGGSPGGGVVHWIRQMTLPAVTLSLGLVGLYCRYVRTATISELHQPYAVVARAKGLSETRVAYRHALRNALVPFVSVLSLDVAAIVGASLAADWVFGMHGLAFFFFQSISRADPFTLTAIVVVTGCVVAAFTLLGDLVVGRLDPRARAAGVD